MITTQLPTLKTKQLSQTGLVLHEIIADGLIHAAAVFGIEQDDRFVERIATIAWFNGAIFANDRTAEAPQIVQQLVESTEAGANSWRKLVLNIAASVAPARVATADIRSFYCENYGTRSIRFDDADSTDVIRQIIGEAVLGGILSQRHFPELHRVLTEQSDKFLAEAAYLSTRVSVWSTIGWKPEFHPFIEMASSFYKERPKRWRLVCCRLEFLLEKAVREKQPWLLDNWLTPAWIDSVYSAKCSIEEITAAMAELSDGEREDNIKIYHECLLKTAGQDGKVSLYSAFNMYLYHWAPFCLENTLSQSANTRIMAVVAYDFAYWMAVIAELPVEDGGQRGVE